MRNRATNKATSALAQAARWLEQREYFPAELRARLIKVGWTPEEADEAMKVLQNKSLLSHSRALEAKVLQRSGKRLVGRDRLRSELTELGADAQSLQEILPDDEDERNRARSLLLSKFPERCDLGRAARFLASRGFEEDIVVSVVEGLEQT